MLCFQCIMYGKFNLFEPSFPNALTDYYQKQRSYSMFVCQSFEPSFPNALTDYYWKQRSYSLFVCPSFKVICYPSVINNHSYLTPPPRLLTFLKLTNKIQKDRSSRLRDLSGHIEGHYVTLVRTSGNGPRLKPLRALEQGGGKGKSDPP